jgi:hypothetical protein
MAESPHTLFETGRRVNASIQKVIADAVNSGVDSIVAAAERLTSATAAVDLEKRLEVAERARQLAATRNEELQRELEATRQNSKHKHIPEEHDKQLNEALRVKSEALETVRRLQTELAVAQATIETHNTTLHAEQARRIAEVQSERARAAQQVVDDTRSLQQGLNEERLRSQNKISELSAEIDRLRQQSELAHHKHREALQDANKHSNDRIAELETKVDTLQKQPTRHPVFQGRSGEVDVMNILQTTFGRFLFIGDVTKEARQTDILLRSPDDQIQISIDVKNYADRVPPQQVAKFQQDIDGLRPAPAGAILFSAGSIPADNSQKTFVRFERGSTVVYHIGRWSIDILIEAIHDIIVHYKVQKEIRELSKRERQVTGARSIQEAFAACFSNLAYDSEQMYNIFNQIDEWKKIRGEAYRESIGFLRQAHSENSVAVPKYILMQAEKYIPLRKSGSPPNPPERRIKWIPAELEGSLLVALAQTRDVSKEVESHVQNSQRKGKKRHKPNDTQLVLHDKRQSPAFAGAGVPPAATLTGTPPGLAGYASVPANSPARMPEPWKGFFTGAEPPIPPKPSPPKPSQSS